MKMTMPWSKSRRWSAFVAWRRRRPFVGGLLTIVAGVEMFFSGQLDVGKIHVQVGIEGLQATILPLILVLLGILAMAMPVHRIFYGVIALAVAVYSLIGDNLGGFFIGMLLASVGGILIVAWMPRSATSAAEPGEPGTPVDGIADRDSNADESAKVARPLVPRRL